MDQGMPFQRRSIIKYILKIRGFLTSIMRIFKELAVKLSVLNDSFKKFDMESIGCQMLLSCESAQLETAQHPIYGELTPRIHKLIRYLLHISS